MNDSLHQMYAYLCDVISFDEDGSIKYFTDLPRNYLMKRPEFKRAQNLFLVYLDYAFDR